MVSHTGPLNPSNAFYMASISESWVPAAIADHDGGFTDTHGTRPWAMSPRAVSTIDPVRWLHCQKVRRTVNG
jgi:hypothetical protein